MGRLLTGRSLLGPSYSRRSASGEPTGWCLPAPNGWQAVTAVILMLSPPMASRVHRLTTIANLQLHAKCALLDRWL